MQCRSAELLFKQPISCAVTFVYRSMNKCDGLISVCFGFTLCSGCAFVAFCVAFSHVSELVFRGGRVR